MAEVKLFLGDFKLQQVNLGDCDGETGYFSLFDLPFYKKILSANENVSVEEISSQIEAHAKLCDSSDNCLELAAGGVGLLNLFIQKNWTGPEIKFSEQLFQLIDFDSRENVLKQLVVDGENIISIVELPELLFLSKIILEICAAHFKNLNIVKVWYVRCLFIHQQILEEFSEELFKKITAIIDEIKQNITELPKTEAVAYYLEFARIYMYYQYIQNSKTDLKNATELSGIEVSLSGALGKRTKFQSEDLAQLILKIDVNNENTLKESPDESLCLTSPQDVKLDDDVRLQKVKYADSADNKYPDLTELQQTVVLANLFQMQKSQPKDSLAEEELQPLINCIVDKSRIWSVRMTALLLRSKLEANHKRTVQRAMLQVQVGQEFKVLSDCLRDTKVSIRQRLSYFFLSHSVPKWEIESTLASILLSLGSIKSALDIYERLHDWENIIYCYNALQLRHKAQEIIEQELKKNPSPKLWCLLGDATDDVSCYEKAWVLSNERSARAQRHWAYFYYYRKNYAKSVEHFQKSLEINSLQKELWYRLGYAALMEEKWEISAHAYRRYCVLDPECFEAWNNLGRCYCELKQKYRAWRALQEALKVDYSNWKVWDNYMLVSSDLRAFDEVIKSYHEILNIKGKHLDLPVLNSLVVGFKSFKEEEENETGKIDRVNFRTKLLELFGRLTSQIINDSELWFFYSEVVDADTPENTVKKYQLLLKAHRSAVNKPDWDSDLEKCNKIIYILSKMIEVGLQTENPDILMSCKLAASGALTKIKKVYPDAGFCVELEKNMIKLDEILSKR